MLARANNSNPQVCNHKHARATDLSLERRTNQTARAKKSSLEPKTSALRSNSKRNPRSIEATLARAKDQNKEIARAKNCSLERRVKILDSNTWFLNPTNLKQTCPTHPIIPNEKIRDNNNNYTMTESTEPKSGYNNQMGKDRGRYSATGKVSTLPDWC